MLQACLCAGLMVYGGAAIKDQKTESLQQQVWPEM
jgi:hypothetical protein